MPKPTDETESFLGRWSRNKRAHPVMPEGVAEPEPATNQESEQEPLTEEQIAALPDIDDLTPQTDIRVFLQKGVPQALRNAALRRKWMLVPGIRDHNDPAVDYAWDWNTPGGVPGDGAAPSPERAAQMLRELFAPRQDPAATQVADTEGDSDHPGSIPTQESAVRQTTAALTQQETAANDPSSEPDTAPQTAQQQDIDLQTDLTPARRRHGGALPA
ncbi:DUF3306 domain-containing protein [Yoonia vestfoldensis]|uniref:DUF3306 domain-containing protein n=1 Tax=Yoonia vestfoldensis SKA53 TaxID=314232 RepID=A3V155_9RHOB|nr:DUF3306 domain-containing protein [Yoonia vestfoldensis]EAQ07873.1 hypothetical protein SKA53_09124 [Yoonia vestfoldensis SKA53]